MRTRFALLAALTAISSTVAAQGVATSKPFFDTMKDMLARSAELMPEAEYGFKPVATVRTFGQILGHLATENYDFCAAAKGEKNPNSVDFEKVAGKAEMVVGLKAAFAYCDAAYTISDAQGAEETTLFGQKMTKLRVLIFNAIHDAEHYGNVVTYLRVKGLVPPSSAQ
jgi:uncharacterized damage-inducible protein DinB